MPPFVRLGWQDASLIAIGTRADTTDALSISSDQRATLFVAIHGYSEAEGDQTERSESRPAKAEHERRARVMMIEPQGPASINGNSGTPCFESDVCSSSSRLPTACP